MKLLGHGIDIADIPKIQDMLELRPVALRGYFTVRERAGLPEGPRRWPHIAGRLALKEAVVKALYTGFVGDLTWTDVEVLSRESGAPLVELSGEASRVADALGVTSWLVSVSHTTASAVGSAIAVSE